MQEEQGSKAVIIVNSIRESLEPYAGKIKTAFVYGSVATGMDTALSDIDLMVIGDELSYSDLYSTLQDAGNVLQREVNPIFLTESDWSCKAADKGSVVSKIMHPPKIFIIGSEKDLQDGQTRTR